MAEVPASPRRRAAAAKPAPVPIAIGEPVELTPARIDALIRLLGDENPRIHSLARGRLLGAFDKARPYLQEQARGASDSEVRREARQLLTAGGRRERLAEWALYAAAPDPLDLEAGAFLLAQVEQPDLDPRPYRAQLDQYAAAVASRCGPSRNPESLVARLCHLLFRELGFKGNRQDYYDPDNSFLHRVLERRLGIPITLSAVCMLVARRLGLELAGIGMPGHFIVRYATSGGGERFLDPFNAGRPMSLEDCREHLRAQNLPLDDDSLPVYSARQMLVRMLENLLRIHSGRGDEEASRRLQEMIEALGAARG